MSATKILNELVVAGDSTSVEQFAREMATRLDQIAGLAPRSHLGSPILVTALEPEAVCSTPVLQNVVPTDQFREIEGVRCRLWLAQTFEGEMIYMFVRGIAVPRGFAINEALAAVLTEVEQPRIVPPIEADNSN